MQDYKVQLDTYSGPMDLLLYLIRREEVDIYDIPISHLLEQYLQYVRVLESLDPDAIGDFLVLAATLMEIKSRLLLPKPPPEVNDDDSLDPRADLVRQLLAYRSFREAAVHLEQRAETQSRRFSRPRMDVPEDDEEQVDIEDAQIWDLLTAFRKLLDSVGQQRVSHEVTYDDTPIGLHADDILDRLERDGPSMRFERIFEGRGRPEMIGLFLALLELMRQKRVRVQQDKVFGTISIHLLDATPITVMGGNVPADVAETEEEGERGESVEAEEHEADNAEWGDERATPMGMQEAFMDEPDDEDDEFARRIGAVEVGEVDLGRSTADRLASEATDKADGNGGADLHSVSSDDEQTTQGDET